MPLSPSTRTNVAAVFTGPGRPLEYWSGDCAAPPEGGMTIQVEMAGVCGSDVHRLDGDQPYPGYPVTFGHEGIGTVAELGAGCDRDWAGTPLRADDRVFWQPTGGCLHCRQCLVGNSALCERMPPNVKIRAGLPSAAAFQRFAVLSPRIAAFRIPEDTPSAAVLALGCALPTALGGFARLGAVEPWHTVVIQGCGPVGLAAAMLAGLTPARQVIVIGAGRGRLEVAQRLGATATIDLDAQLPGDRNEKVLELTGGAGADVVIEAAGQIAAFQEGLDMLAVEGRFLLLGLFSGSATVPFNPVLINNRNQRIIGSLSAQPSARQSTIFLAQRYHDKLPLEGLVTARFPLEELEAAIDTVRKAKTVKTVVEPNRAAG
jgi:threonine dehydrogenase-like Zn-dependent dehydrogenase